MAEEFIKNVKFSGNQAVRDDMVALVDMILKDGTGIDTDIDLAKGLTSVAETCKIKIIDEDDSLSVIIEPEDGSGVPLRFTIHKKTKSVYQVADELQDEVSIDEDMDFLDDI